MPVKRIFNPDPDNQLLDKTASKPWQDRIGRSSKISATVALQWDSGQASHTDIQFLDNLNVWRDFFPEEIEKQLSGKQPGEMIECEFAFNDLLPDYERKQHTVKRQQFNREFRRGQQLEPRLGRFYPKAIYRDIADNNASNMQPSRVINLDENFITADFSHPLANRDLSLHMQINQVWDVGSERGGRCTDIAQLICDDGPGMQARYMNTATDFFNTGAFERMDPADDAVFYEKPRMVQHLDSTCRAQVRQLYSELLPANCKILDLMASHDSHLPVTLKAQITGLGMNAEELAANPGLDNRVIHDLNRNSPLPFGSNHFDAIICAASFEYLIAPQRVLRELARVLKPGGLLVFVFSNRWFPTRAIRLWSELHEFERMGFVSECLLQSGKFDKLNTLSSRGWMRPLDDKYASEILLSDPVYAVWATCVQDC